MSFIFFILIALAAFVVGAKVVRENKLKYIAFGGGVVALIAALGQAVTVIPAGNVGVVDLFGSVSETTLKPGINFVNPLADVITFSVKTQEVKEEAKVPSKEGLSVSLELSVLYHLDPNNADDIYKTVGQNYTEVILVPLLRSVTRGVTAEYEAKALYTSERELLARKIQQELSQKLEPRGILVEGTPLRKVELPQKVTDAIEDKLRAEQESQRMEFVLTKEKQEAERKRIEAQGIADFQKTVSEGIDANLLKWKGIEATEKLATSQNAKVIVIGSGNDQLPVILGGQ